MGIQYGSTEIGTQTAEEQVEWKNHFGEQHGNMLYIWRGICPMTQQFYFKIYILQESVGKYTFFGISIC